MLDLDHCGFRDFHDWLITSLFIHIQLEMVYGRGKLELAGSSWPQVGKLRLWSS